MKRPWKCSTPRSVQGAVVAPGFVDNHCHYDAHQYTREQSHGLPFVYGAGPGVWSIALERRPAYAAFSLVYRRVHADNRNAMILTRQCEPSTQLMTSVYIVCVHEGERSR